jgi:hypothetical protein
MAVGAFPVVVSILLLLLLFLLHYLSHLLRGMLRVFTSYLVATEASGWEQDWAKYREDSKYYWAYTKPQTMVFMILSLLAGLFPFALAQVYDLTLQPQLGLALLVGVWILSEFGLWAMGFKEFPLNGDRVADEVEGR